MSSSGIGDGIDTVIMTMFVALCITLPLGIWKAVEIIIWLCHHIHIG